MYDATTPSKLRRTLAWRAEARAGRARRSWFVAMTRRVRSSMWVMLCGSLLVEACAAG
jgi:hypothetical protein